MIYDNKKKNLTISSEGAEFEEGMEVKKNENPNHAGYPDEKPLYSPEFIESLGAERDEELHSDPAYSDFFRHPKIMSSFTEHFDLSDNITRKAILVMNEAEQTAVLTSLTSKLYDNIVAKVDDIDFGDIPASKGDITKLPNYDKLRECIDLIRGIIKEFKQDTSPIDVVSEAMANIQSRKDLFARAFRYNIEMPMIMYNVITLSIINSVSYMIATSIEFMKTPNQDSFKIVLDKVAFAKTKSNMIYNNLKKFNDCCKNGDFDKAMNHVIDNRVKGFGEAAALGGIGTKLSAAVGSINPVVGIGLAIVSILLLIIPMLKNLVFFFFYARMRVSEFFDIQADLLQMNAYSVANRESVDSEERSRIASKQLKIVELFRKMANKISFTNKKAEVDATREIDKSSKKMKIGDLGGELPDSVSALF